MSTSLLGTTTKGLIHVIASLLTSSKIPAASSFLMLLFVLARLFATLYNYIDKKCRFELWTVQEHSFSNICSKVELKSLYGSRWAASWSILILWFSSLPWNIQTNGQYLNWDSKNALKILFYQNLKIISFCIMQIAFCWLFCIYLAHVH